jgi:hypothetical protein
MLRRTSVWTAGSSRVVTRKLFCLARDATDLVDVTAGPSEKAKENFSVGQNALVGQAEFHVSECIDSNVHPDFQAGDPLRRLVSGWIVIVRRTYIHSANLFVLAKPDHRRRLGERPLAAVQRPEFVTPLHLQAADDALGGIGRVQVADNVER